MIIDKNLPKNLVSMETEELVKTPDGTIVDSKIKEAMESNSVGENQENVAVPNPWTAPTNLQSQLTGEYSASSKRRFVVEESNWGAQASQRVAGVYELGAAGIDGIRDAAGKYWTFESFDEAQQGSLTFLNKSLASSKAMGVPFGMVINPPIYVPMPNPEQLSGPNPFFEVKQVIKLIADKSQFQEKSPDLPDTAPPFYMSSKWKKMLVGNPDPESADYNPVGGGLIEQFIEHDYFAFNVPLYHTDEETEGFILGSQQYVSITPEYNFFIEEYETGILATKLFSAGDEVGIPERNLPNIYALMLEKANVQSNPHFVEHLTLGGALTSAEAGSLDGAPSDKFNIKKHAGQYFAAFGRSIANINSLSVFGIGNKFKNIVLPWNSVTALNDFKRRKELFPIFIDIDISMGKAAQLAGLLKEMNLLDRFVLEVAKNVSMEQGYTEQGFQEISEAIIIDDNGAVDKKTAANTVDNKVWDITSWLEKICMVDLSTGAYKQPDTTAAEAAALLKIIVMDDGAIEKAQVIEPQNKFYQSLMGVIFAEKLKKVMKSNFTSYSDLSKGKPNHAETVLYKVEKWATSPTTGNQVGSEPLQSYWFPNLPGQDVASIVDTQVKYGKQYKYIVYAYQAVFKTIYHYDDINVFDSEANILVVQKPKLVLVEQKVFEETRMIMDSPPIAPEASIIPYAFDKNNLLINLNSAVGEYELEPITLRMEEVDDINNLRIAQNVSAESPILYKNDDSVGDGGYFEIYRLSYKPMSWSDFSAPYALVAINEAFGASIKASSAAYKDSIASNVKHYYMFRVKDAHGHYSNPSSIYEVEIVSDGSATYFTKRVVDFAPKEPFLPSKPMRRLIEIKPAFDQAFASIEGGTPSAYDVKNFSLGNDVGPWGKRYKFRFVSKKTGKKFDLNVKFKTEMEQGLLPE